MDGLYDTFSGQESTFMKIDPEKQMSSLKLNKNKLKVEWKQTTEPHSPDFPGVGGFQEG